MRTVRLDPDAEAVLSRLKKRTGKSVSALLKAGLHALEGQAGSPAARPYDIFAQLDLGPGGYAKAPARDSRQAVAEVLHQKRKAGR